MTMKMKEKDEERGEGKEREGEGKKEEGIEGGRKRRMKKGREGRKKE